MEAMKMGAKGTGGLLLSIGMRGRGRPPASRSTHAVPCAARPSVCGSAAPRCFRGRARAAAVALALLCAAGCCCRARATYLEEVVPLTADGSCFEQPALKGLRNDFLAKTPELQATLKADFKCAHIAAARLQEVIAMRRGSSMQAEAPSRGIVYAGAGKFQMSNILIGVRHLRYTLNCTLPIEVVHHGYLDMPVPLASELMKDPRLQPLTIVDSKALAYPAHHRKVTISDYATKVFALYAGTSFDEVLLMDADSYPLADPAVMFEAAPYKEYGNLFFPDFWDGSSSNQEVHQLLAVPPPWKGDPSYRGASSGQFLFNRRKLAVVLEWVWYLNSHYPFVYRKMGSDKDTYRLAFQLAGEADAFQQSPVWSSMLLHTGSAKGCGSRCSYPFLGAVHFSGQGAPWFVHRIQFYPTVDAKLRHKNGSAAWPDTVSLPASHTQAMKLRAAPNVGKGKPQKRPCQCLTGTDLDLTSQRKCAATASPPKAPKQGGSATVSQLASGCGWEAGWAKGADRKGPLTLVPAASLRALGAGLASLKAAYLRLKPTLDELQGESKLLRINPLLAEQALRRRATPRAAQLFRW